MQSLQLILCPLLLSTLVLPLPAQPASSAHFPTVTAYSLSKAKVALPAQLTGTRNLLVLSFDNGDTPDVDHWTSAAQSLTHRDAGLSYYVLPISAQKNPLYRWWDNSAMRNDFSNQQMWPRVVPLYVNENRFRRQLQIPNGAQTVVLLTDRAGNVLWRAAGAPDPQKLATLQAQLHS